jgi:hypothetical protein
MGFLDDINEMANPSDGESIPKCQRTEHDQFVINCLRANERGDGMLFARMLRGKFAYQRDGKKWLRSDKGSWVPDLYREVINAVEVCALEYERVAGSLCPYDEKTVKDLWSRAWRLRTLRGAKRVLFWAPIVDPTIMCREEDAKRLT